VNPLRTAPPHFEEEKRHQKTALSSQIVIIAVLENKTEQLSVFFYLSVAHNTIKRFEKKKLHKYGKDQV
jgi:hypothetical protein